MAVEPADVADALATVARRLATHRDVEGTLEAIMRSAVETIPGAEFGGISTLEGRNRVVARLQTDPLITEIDDVQTDLAQGPCLAAMTEERHVLATDLTTDRRWPAFAAAVRDCGVHSALSLRLHLDSTAATLSLFARRPDAFTPDAEVVGELFATHAAVALAGVRREQQLNHAVRTRDVIGMAKGIIMSEYRLSEQDAFATLVRLSQSEQVKLHDLAARLVASAERQAIS